MRMCAFFMHIPYTCSGIRYLEFIDEHQRSVSLFLLFCPFLFIIIMMNIVGLARVFEYLLGVGTKIFSVCS